MELAEVVLVMLVGCLSAKLLLLWASMYKQLLVRPWLELELCKDRKRANSSLGWPPEVTHVVLLTAVIATETLAMLRTSTIPVRGITLRCD